MDRRHVYIQRKKTKRNKKKGNNAKDETKKRRCVKFLEDSFSPM